MIHEDFRIITLLDWLENGLLLTVNKLEPASSDASFRRYFRASLPDKTVIVMDAPPDKENIEPFLKVAGILEKSNVNVPTIYYQNLEEGFLVLEDFGSQCYLDELNESSANALYNAALASLYKLQTNTIVGSLALPRYDEALLHRELGIFAEWFIEQKLGLGLPEPMWDEVCEILVNSALTQPVTCVHRDFHSRNLMVIGEESPGVIDFQDAVVGPVTYDLVSLLRDCYIAWPQEQISYWVNEYYQKLKQVGIVNADLAHFTRWFDLMGMQRHLKAIGIFSRLAIRDGKTGYLKDIPRTLNYVLEQTHQYPEFKQFGDFLNQKVIPVVKAST